METPTTSTMRRVDRPGRRFGRMRRSVARPGRTSVARTSKLEAAGPVIFLIVLAVVAIGATVGYLAIGV